MRRNERSTVKRGGPGSREPNYLNLTPGPTNIPLKISEHFKRTKHHRIGPYHLTEELPSIVMMKVLFGAINGEVRYKCASGTDMMDEVGVNLISPGDRVLIINAGYFGERWAKIAKMFQADTQELFCRRGETFNKKEVERALLAENFKLVLAQETETSTGVEHDTGFIGKIIKEHSLSTLLVVDAVYEAFVSPIDMGAQNIDLLVGTCQKALMQPPGLGFSILRPRAIKASQESHWPSFSHSYKLDLEAIRADEVRFTPPANHIAALSALLSEILHNQASLERWFRAFETRARWIRKKMYGLGFKLFTKDSPSNGMSALELPHGWDIHDFQEFMLQRNIWVAGAIGSPQRPYIRLAHLSGVTRRDLRRFVYWTQQYKKLYEAAH